MHHSTEAQSAEAQSAEAFDDHAARLCVVGLPLCDCEMAAVLPRRETTRKSQVACASVLGTIMAPFLIFQSDGKWALDLVATRKLSATSGA